MSFLAPSLPVCQHMRSCRQTNPKQIQIDEVNQMHGGLLLHSTVQRDYIEAIRLTAETNIDDEINENGETALQWTLKNGEDAIACLLLDRGANWKLVDKNGATSLHYAAHGDCTEAARLLLEAGADIDKVDKERKTALQRALKNGSDLTACLLLQHSANWKLVDDSGVPSLHYAAQGDCTEAIQSLLDAGAEIDEIYKNGETSLETALQWALKHGKDASACLLLQRGANWKLVVQEKPFFTLLHYAVKGNCTKAIKLLLEVGVDVVEIGRNIETDLQWALKTDNDTWACSLLQRITKRKTLDKFDKPLLHYAAKGGCTEAVRLLLDAGFEIKDVDANKQTALELALKNGKDATACLLLQRGANWKEKDAFDITPLQWAAAFGCAEAVRMLLEMGEDIDKINNNEETILHKALECGKDATACLLLHRGANWKMVDKFGKTSLHCAAIGGCTESVRLLLNAGAYIDEMDQNEQTALHKALKNSKDATACLLLHHGANWKIVNKFTSLHLAAKSGCTKAVQLLLDASADIDEVGTKGETVFHKALKNSKDSTALLLLQRGANWKAVSEYGNTSLHYAAMGGCTEIVKLLLDLGANIDELNMDEDTAFLLALKNGKDSTACLMLKRGANVNQADIYGATPLHVASERGITKVVKLILDADANINAVNSQKNTALHLALQYSYCTTACLLIQRGANINVTNEYGRFPIHSAAIQRCTEVVRLMLDKGVNINQEDWNKNTALHWALENGHTTTAILLIERGSNVYLANKCNKTPLQLILRRWDVMEWLLEYEFNNCPRSNLMDHLQQIQWEHYSIKSCELFLMYFTRRGQELDFQHLKDTLSYDQWNFYQDCLEETRRMRLDVVYEDLSVFDLFRRSKKRLALLISDNNLMITFKTVNYIKKYPIYAELLIDSLEKARIYSEQIKFATKALELIFMQGVTDIISLCILQHLNETELYTLKCVYEQAMKKKD